MKILYHDDNDGRCAAAALRAFSGIALEHQSGIQESDFIPMDYGKPFAFQYDEEIEPQPATGKIIPIEKGETVFILDFSIEPALMENLLGRTGGRVVWIDHHIKAIEKYADFGYAIPGLRQDGYAGCALTWWWCLQCSENDRKAEDWWIHGGTELEASEYGFAPKVIRLVSDYDTWAWRKMEPEAAREVEAFYAGAGLENTDPYHDFWERMFSQDDAWAGVCASGNTIIAYRNQFYAEVRVAAAFEFTLEGYRGKALNVCRMGSLCFSEEDRAKYDILGTFYHTGEKFTMSLYTENPNIDVGAICVRYGGGGHKGAAGFSSAYLPFEPDYVVPPPKLNFNCETPEQHVHLHMSHFAGNILPGLKMAFERGSEKYRGYSHHWDGAAFDQRTAESDVHHVRECHAGVRLAEAEDLASCGDLAGAMAKIESAIGYLGVLHLRMMLRKEGMYPRPTAE